MRKKRNPKFKVEVVYKETPDAKDRLRQLSERAIQNVMALHGYTDPTRSARRKKAVRFYQKRKRPHS